MGALERKSSFKTKLILIVLAVNLIVSALFVLLVYQSNALLLRRESRRTAEATLSGLVLRIESFIESKSKISIAIARNPQVLRWLRSNEQRLPDPARDRDYTEIMDYFRRLRDEDGDLYSVFIGSEKSQMYYDTTDEKLPDDYRIGVRPWYVHLKENRADYYVVVNDVFGANRVNHYMPVIDEEGRFLGACGVDIGIDRINHFLSQANPFHNAPIFLVNEQGQIIVHQDTTKVLKEKISDYKDDGSRFSGFSSLVPRILKGDSLFEEVLFEGRKTMLVSASIPRLGFRLIMTVDSNLINAPLHQLVNRIILLSLLNWLLLFAILWYSMDRITRPLRLLTKRVGALAHGEGDLRQRLEIHSRDEIGELAVELNHFIAGLQEMVTRVKENTQVVSSSSHQFSATTEELAATAEEHNLQSQAVTVSIKHLAEASDSIAQSVEEAQTRIENSSNLTNQGSRTIRSTIDALRMIKNNAGNLSTILEQLNRSAGEINKITEVITEVADQTNLLALNAAIESARAGEAGRGFAVVASEVRKLAERTARSTREIAVIVEGLQEGVGNAGQAMQTVNSEIDRGNDLSQDSLGILDQIVSISVEVMDSSHEIVSAVMQENRSIEEINDSLAAMASGSSEAAKAVRNLAVTAEDLSAQAEFLQSQIERFKT